MFELFFYGKDKGPDEWDLSKRNPSSAEMLSIAQGWGIFADVLAPKAANRARSTRRRRADDQRNGQRPL